MAKETKVSLCPDVVYIYILLLQHYYYFYSVISFSSPPSSTFPAVAIFLLLFRSRFYIGDGSRCEIFLNTFIIQMKTVLTQINVGERVKVHWTTFTSSLHVLTRFGLFDISKNRHGFYFSRNFNKKVYTCILLYVYKHATVRVLFCFRADAIC